MTSILQQPKQCQVLKGEGEGPTVAIIGCTHGDERIGAEILEWLMESISPDVLAGEVRLILGNPEAYEKNARFLEEDLNRLMSDARLKEIEENGPKHGEEARAIELAELLNGVSYLLDIHATVKPTPHSFTYIANTEQHKTLSRCFAVDYAVMEKDKSVTSYPEGPLDCYVDRKGGVGITLEAGSIASDGLLEITKQGVQDFLSEVGCTEKIDYQPHSQKKLVIYHEIKAETDTFRFSADHANFASFKKGETIAYDGDTPMLADRECVIIFPKTNIKKGKEAGYLAENL